MNDLPRNPNDRLPRRPEEPCGPTSRPVTRNIGVLLVGRALGAAIGITGLTLLTRNLSVGDFGFFSYAVALFNLLVIFIGLGGNAIATAEMARQPGRTEETLGLLLGLRVASAAVAVAMLVVIALVSESPATRPPLLIIAPFLLFSSLAAMDALFHARQRMIVPVASRLVAQALFVVAVVFLVSGDRLTLVAVCWAFGISVAIERLITFARGFAVARPHMPASFAAVTGFVRRATPQGLATLFGLLYFHVDTLMLRHLQGEIETGIYSAPYRLFAFLVVVPGLLAAPLLPEMARGADACARTLRTVAGQALVLGGAAMAALLVLATPIVEVIYGLDEYGDSVVILRWLAVAFPAICVGTLGGTGLIALERQALWARITFVCLLLNVGLNVVLIPSRGAEGAALATVATEVLAAGWAAVAVLRIAAVRLPVSSLIEPVLVALGVGLVAWLCRPLGIWTAAGVLGLLGAAYAMTRSRRLLDRG